MRRVSLFVFLMMFGCLFCCGASWGLDLTLRFKVIDVQTKKQLTNVRGEYRVMTRGRVTGRWKDISLDYDKSREESRARFNDIKGDRIDLKFYVSGYQSKEEIVWRRNKRAGVRTVRMRPSQESVMPSLDEVDRPGVTGRVVDDETGEILRDFTVYVSKDVAGAMKSGGEIQWASFGERYADKNWLTGDFFVKATRSSQSDSVLIAIGAKGYKPAMHRVVFDESEVEQVEFRLKRQSESILSHYDGRIRGVWGRIVDEDTGRPIDEASIVLSRKVKQSDRDLVLPMNDRNTTYIDTDGYYLLTPTHVSYSRYSGDMVLLVKAKGYEPKLVEGFEYKQYKLDRADIRLKRASESHKITVHDPEGEPAVGAKVFVFKDQAIGLVKIDDDQVTADEYETLVETDEQGECEIRLPRGEYSLIAVHESGICTQDIYKVAVNDVIELGAWRKGQVVVEGYEGELLAGRMIGENRVFGQDISGQRVYGHTISFDVGFSDGKMLGRLKDGESYGCDGYVEIEGFDKKKHRESFRHASLQSDRAGEQCYLKRSDTEVVIKGVVGEILEGELGEGWYQKEAKLIRQNHEKEFYDEHVTAEMEVELDRINKIEDKAARFAAYRVFYHGLENERVFRVNKVGLLRPHVSDFVIKEGGEFTGYVVYAGRYEMKIVLENEAGETKELTKEFEISKPAAKLGYYDMGMVWFDDARGVEESEDDGE